MSKTKIKTEVTLLVCFDKDQRTGVKNLLSLMRKEGKLLYSEMEGASWIESVPMDAYTLTFDSPYSLYEFGWKSAGLYTYMNFEG